MDWLLIFSLILAAIASTTLAVVIAQQEKTIRYQRGIIDRLLSGHRLGSFDLEEIATRQTTGA